jgi:hypothetical protein
MGVGTSVGQVRWKFVQLLREINVRLYSLASGLYVETALIGIRYVKVR